MDKIQTGLNYIAMTIQQAANAYKNNDFNTPKDRLKIITNNIQIIESELKSPVNWNKQKVMNTGGSANQNLTVQNQGQITTARQSSWFK